MTILQTYKTKVDCYDNSCSVRYYTNDGELAIGLLRLNYQDMGGINGMVVTVTEWSVGEMISDIYDNDKKTPDEMLDIIRDIKTDAVNKVKEHLNSGVKQVTSD